MGAPLSTAASGLSTGSYRLDRQLSPLYQQREAEMALSELKKMEPDFSLMTVQKRFPLDRFQNHQSFIEGLRKTALPAYGITQLFLGDLVFGFLGARMEIRLLLAQSGQLFALRGECPLMTELRHVAGFPKKDHNLLFAMVGNEI